MVALWQGKVPVSHIRRVTKMCMEWLPHILSSHRKSTMTIQHKNYLSRIARRVEQGALPAIPPHVAVEKLITEKKKENDTEKRK